MCLCVRLCVCACVCVWSEHSDWPVCLRAGCVFESYTLLPLLSKSPVLESVIAGWMLENHFICTRNQKYTVNFFFLITFKNTILSYNTSLLHTKS